MTAYIRDHEYSYHHARTSTYEVLVPKYLLYTYHSSYQYKRSSCTDYEYSHEALVRASYGVGFLRSLLDPHIHTWCLRVSEGESGMNLRKAKGRPRLTGK